MERITSIGRVIRVSYRFLCCIRLIALPEITQGRPSIPSGKDSVNGNPELTG